ncbi:MAG: DNA primase [Alteromonas naphthalenivorans]|jgi:DNA primase
MNLFSFVKQRLSILDVVQEHLVLKKAGNYWKGACPFHSEKTGSFTVSPHRGIFYCFGCQESGDVIGFISKIENCTQVEAAKHLAERHNIELPETISQVSTEKTDEKKRYFAVCQAVASWCHTQLFKHPSVMLYLEKRGFSQASINTFKIGYFPGGSRSIRTLARDIADEQFMLKDLFDAGIASEGKTLYSAFEQRLIFPIKDHLGNNCGFGGRVLKKTDERSKYYNSKENDYFLKGSLLFGLDLAKKEIQKTGHVFMVEGYTDCIAMAQYGYRNTVATLGTSCTIEHLKLLSHHAQTVYLVYDSDAAGQKAMLRLAELCWQVNLDLQVIFLPEGHDPATYLNDNGDLKSAIAQAKDILLFYLEALGKDFSHQPLQQKLASTRSFLAIVANLSDPFKQDIILQKASGIFNLPFNSLKKEMGYTKKNKPIAAKTEEKLPQMPVFELSSLEKKFMCAILNNTQLLDREEVKRLLHYTPKPLQDLIAKLKQVEGSDESETFVLFFDTLEYHQKSMVNELLVSQENEEDFDQIVILLEKKYWKTIVSGTKLQLARAEADHNKEAVQKIVTSFLDLKKKLLRKGLI